MKRLVFVLALLLLLASQANAWTWKREPLGAGTDCGGSLAPGQICYAVTIDGDETGFISVDACDSVKIRFWSNVASSTDHDATCQVLDLPKTVTSTASALARPVGYRDSSGAQQTTLTGDQSVGRDAIYGFQTQGNVGIITVMPASQTGMISVTCFGEHG